MDFAGAVASAASALTIVKQLNDVDRSLSEGELKKRTATAKPMIELDGFQYEEVNGRANGLLFCPNCLLENVQIRPVKVLQAHQCPRCKSNFSRLRYAS